MKNTETLRKIIHVDMDCFYAAIEIRDNPALLNKPVAVGGPSKTRGVLCTCNYLARQYGVRSAMPTAVAFRQCPDLVLLPVNMPKYRAVAKRIQAIFHEFTTLVEPLSLDEAYLDVSNSSHYQGSATLIAQAICQQILARENLTASAGVAPNKFLAKIASGWNKPNGLFVIRPNEVKSFIETLPVKKLYGVGKVTAEKLHSFGLTTCADLQKFSFAQLTQQFGKLGHRLYEQCQGLDQRPVEPNRPRKSLSVEKTFYQNLNGLENCLEIIHDLYNKLIQRLQEQTADRTIKNQYIKIKFSDFKQTTMEVSANSPNFERYLNLFRECYAQEKRAIRLLGVGVHFTDQNSIKSDFQQSVLDI